MNLIVARQATNHGIGFNNTLPWPHQSEDMKWFKQHTAGKTVVMGRNTFESLGSKPLPQRHNIVITSDAKKLNKKYGLPDLTFMSLEHLFGLNTDSFWLIGGGQLYQTLLPYVQTMYITEINHEAVCDSYFEFDETGLKIMAMDTSHVVLIFAKMEADEFEFYKCTAESGKVFVGLNMFKLHSSLNVKSISPDLSKAKLPNLSNS